MKKIITFAGIAILFVLLSAPSFVKAANPDPSWGSSIPAVGTVYMRHRNYNTPVTFTVRCYIEEPFWVYVQSLVLWTSPTLNSATGGEHLLIYYAEGSSEYIGYDQVIAMYIPTLEHNYTINGTTKIFNNVQDYNSYVPESERLPEPTWIQNLWSEFYDFLEFQLGLDPFDGGIWEFFHNYINSDNSQEIDILFPTNTPTPTPTPRPTPIPVQTIYVPDGNGSYTIVYQYPDPNGNITQSPYNPNVEVNVDVNCNCDNGNNYNPQDPMYYPFDGLTWASIEGDLSDTPAMSAGQSLDIIKAEVDSYDEPIKVVSNSFGALPGKWLSLVGLLGACIIVAGLIRTFLGG